MLKNNLSFFKLRPGKNINRTVCLAGVIIPVFIISYCMNVSPVIAGTEENFPYDVTAFFHDADICQYLSGEWDDSLPQKRRNELSSEMNEKCSNIYKRQEYFRKKYVGHKLIMLKLNSYEF